VVGHSKSAPDVQRILDLQGSVGNHGVAVLLAAAQPKLKVGSANDRYEREADDVADRVMAHLGPNVRFKVLAGTVGDADGVMTSDLQRRATADAPALGRSGGEVDADTETQIGALRTGGSSLPSRLRSPMEGAFGVNFDKVRIHRGRAPKMLCRKMSAIAFTVGSDVFLGSGAPPLEHPAGQHLLAHELVHTIQQGAIGRISKPAVRRSVNHSGLVQRLYGTDPSKLITEDSHDLLYGNNDPRAATKSRLEDKQKNKLRTIDEYNRVIGINSLITSMFAAIGLFYLREQLNSTTEWGLSAWKDRKIDLAKDEAPEKWIAFLRKHKTTVGLVDLGQKGGLFGKAKIDQKNRFKKNRAFSQADQAKGDQLTSEEIRQFLGLPTVTDAQTVYTAMSPKKQAALNAWVYRALFRRTSKLGQDFAVKELGATIHFNVASDPNYKPPRLRPTDSGNIPKPNWDERGVITQGGQKINKNRPITVSEYRHMKKLQKEHPSKFNVYGENPL
jgi:hypothetical protein